MKQKIHNLLHLHLEVLKEKKIQKESFEREQELLNKKSELLEEMACEN